MTTRSCYSLVRKALVFLEQKGEKMKKPAYGGLKTYFSILVIVSFLMGLASGTILTAAQTRTITLTLTKTVTITTMTPVTITTTKTIISSVTVITTMTQKSILTAFTTAIVTLKPSRIVVDGDDSDWKHTLPLIIEMERDLSRNNYKLGVADIKEVFLIQDAENLYFLIKFWDPVNFNLNPSPDEVLTSLYVNIYVKEWSKPILQVYIHPLWGKMHKYIGVDFDGDDDYEEESDRVGEITLAYKNNIIEFSISIGTIREITKKLLGYTSNALELEIFSCAWLSSDGGYHGDLDFLKRVTYNID